MSTNDPTSPSDHDPSATTGDAHIRPANAADSAGEDQSETFRPDRSAAIARLRGRVSSVRERLSRALERGSRGMLAMYGVGYPVLQRTVGGQYVILALLGLLAAKILATSLTMSIGGSGGVFTPSLFMGAMLGSAYGTVAHHLMPGLAAAAGAYGLVGMGAVFAATARAPITGLIIIFELTGDYRIILPLMCAIVVATALSSRITKDTIYTLKLRRRGIDIDAPRTPSRMAQITVAEAMGRTPRAVRPEQPLREIVERFATERTDSLPVTDAVGSLTGVIAASDLERAISHRTDNATLAREVPLLQPTDSLEDAVQALASADDEGLPVIDEDNQLIGWITHRQVLRTYLRRFGAPEDNARRPAPPPLAAAAATRSPTPADRPRP